MIPPELIEQIAAANDIVEVIGGYFPLKRAGGTYKALCPFHQERSPSFTVNPHRQMFKCFGCGAGGSVFRFVMDYEHIEFGAAVRRLAERAGIRVVEEEMSAEDRAKVSLRKRLLALHAATADWFHLQLMRTKGAAPARDYLKKRGLSAEIAKAWKIGYAPDGWDHLGGWARQQGYSHDEIMESGLVTWKEDDQGRPTGQPYDRFRHRIMFPICDGEGQVLAFSGRTLEADAKGAKYVNSPETPLFTKGKVLFGLHRTMRPMIDKKAAIVFEGQIDLITAFEAGVQNAIAPQGTAFTEQQAHLLRRYVGEAGEVILCFDADAAGTKAAERSLASLLAEGLTVKVIQMPAGEDPDSLIRTQGAEAFLALVHGARDFFEAQLDRLTSAPEFNSARGRAEAIRKVAEWVSLVSDSLLREGVMNRVTTRLGVSTKEFVRLLAKPKTFSRSAAARHAPAEAAAPESPALLTDLPLRLLAMVSLQDIDARAWLLNAPWRELLAREAEAGLLVKILEAHLPSAADDPAALSAFLTTLEPEEEALVSSLLEEKPRPNALMVASDCWNSLARRQVERHIESLRARLRAPQLPIEETLRLHKEILDQQTHLLNIARPLSPPL